MKILLRAVFAMTITAGTCGAAEFDLNSLGASQLTKYEISLPAAEAVPAEAVLKGQVQPAFRKAVKKEYTRLYENSEVNTLPVAKESELPAAAKIRGANDSKLNVAGIYEIKTMSMVGNLEVRPLTYDVAFALATTGPGPEFPNASISGIARLNGNTAMFMDNKGCMVSMKFSTYGVSLRGQNCASYMGLNGAIDGDYLKTGPAIPGKLDGDYIARSNDIAGTIEAREFPEHGLVFHLLANTSTGTSSTIDGTAERNPAGNFEFFGEDNCKLLIKPVKDSLVVENGGTCRYYLALNGSVDGTYNKK